MSDKPTVENTSETTAPSRRKESDYEDPDGQEEKLQKYSNSQEQIEVDKTASMEECMGRSIQQLSTVFAASAKRWETIVYPSLFAFILLAAYGFFLIYSLATDVHRVAESMIVITENMQDVSGHMRHMTENVAIMTKTVDSQSHTMGDMAVNIRGMNSSMAKMRYDIATMNNSVSRPMSFMNSFMPW